VEKGQNFHHPDFERPREELLPNPHQDPLLVRRDQLVSAADRITPIISTHEDGSQTVIHTRRHYRGYHDSLGLHRLPNGEVMTMRANDIVHQFDPDGVLLERKRADQGPSSLVKLTDEEIAALNEERAKKRDQQLSTVAKPHASEERGTQDVRHVPLLIDPFIY
jgi:hypothetical protein